ncbi:MAG: hypothetical protein HYS13_03035 [Planctomycetia bacterium]|nr:hypothetical protein [Planctomycetia bacterium]
MRAWPTRPSAAGSRQSHWRPVLGKPLTILALRSLWLAVFLYTGRSAVTDWTLTFSALAHAGDAPDRANLHEKAAA